MKGDRKRKQSVAEINHLSFQWMSYVTEFGNQCAYTDTLIDKIIAECEKLKAL